MKHFKCDECKQIVSSPVPDNSIFRGMIICPECIEKIPDDVVNRFLQEWAKAARAELENKYSELPNEYISGLEEKKGEQKPREVRYGIGIDHGNNSIGMCHGPYIELQMALEIDPGPEDNFLLFRFNSDGTDELLYKWNGEKWILEDRYRI